LVAAVVTTLRPLGFTLSITSTTLSKVVPYFAYPDPSMGMTARTSYSDWIFFHQSLNVGLSMDIPSPTMATRRPPGAVRLRACSTCRAPTFVLLLFCIRPAVALNGGFMTTTVGTSWRGRMLLIVHNSGGDAEFDIA
jgi:hypothetical protein